MAASAHIDSRGSRVLWYATVVVAATFMTCLHLANNTPWKLATFAQLVNFQAAEPFQHRILLPALVAGLQQLLPLQTKLLFGVFEWVEWIALILVAERGLQMFAIGASRSIRRVLALSVLAPMYLSLMAPNMVLRPAFALADGRIGLGDWGAGSLFYYVYDLPAALFTLAMALVLIRESKAPSARGLAIYFGLFIVATFNRETSAFMIAFFALLFFRVMDLRRLVALLAVQSVVFFAIQLPLYWLFADNVNPSARLAGTQYENHLLLNLSILAQPLFFITFLARFAAGLWLPVLIWHRALDRRIAIALIGFGLPLVFFALLGGVIREYRIFIELMPLIWLAALQVMAAPITARTPSVGTRD